MNTEQFHDPEAVKGRNDILNIPAESLFDRDTFAELWPESVTGNPDVTEQIYQRKKLIAALDDVQSSTTDPAASFEALLDEGVLEESQIATLYEELANMLERSPEYRRIVLYLPFEYLLDEAWVPASHELAEQAERFKKEYLRAWESLLNVLDVRANFVDGDVLETERRTGDLPRVAKAAHLAPFLAKKGWLTADDVLELHDASQDGTVRESFAGAIGAMRAMGIVDDATATAHGAPIPAAKKEPKSVSLDPDAMRREIDERLAGEIGGDMTAKRRAWLADVRKQKTIEDIGDGVRAALLDHLPSDGASDGFLRPGAHAPTQLAFLDGLRKAIELAAREDTDEAAKLYASFDGRLRTLWTADDPVVRPALEKLFFRVHDLGVVDEASLRSLGLVVPALDGPFMDNVRRMDVEKHDVAHMLDALRADPELSRYVYPVVLLYGSKVKGYGAKNADTDLGVFITPDVPPDVAAKLRGMLANIFMTDAHADPVTEFWLDRTDDGLEVHEFASHDRALGSKAWTHVLFGAAWEGDADAIKELHGRLLAGYFRDADEEMYGLRMRDLSLETLEKDVLQYRLMHKGYERYYPTRKDDAVAGAEGIDGRSAFWDSGYRAMATKLFAEKVFLPRLER